jgi:predicted transcriptional regulator
MLTDRTITLPSDLVEQLERLAEQQARSMDEVLRELLNAYAPVSRGNWALAVADGMAAADIPWKDDADASAHSREHFNQHLREQWERTQRDG